MKKIIPMHICAAFIVSDVFCQMTKNFATIEMPTSDTDELKDETGSFLDIEKKHINAVNIKVVRAFIKDFRDAEKVNWSEATDGGYIAQFILDSVQTTIGYSSDGTWNYILKRYAEKKMSTDLRTLVKSTFFDYTIMEVVEIKLPNEEDNIIYRVMIKKEDNFKILRICNSDMEIAGDYTKP
jgi:hypothetical protein